MNYDEDFTATGSMEERKMKWFSLICKLDVYVIRHKLISNYIILKKFSGPHKPKHQSFS